LEGAFPERELGKCVGKWNSIPGKYGEEKV
jgi:hypothetical protein